MSAAMLANRTTTVEATFRQGRTAVSLLHLFAWAHKVVPRKGNESNEAYMQTWLGYMRHQWWVCWIVPASDFSAVEN